MNKNNLKNAILKRKVSIIIIVVLAGLFYWYEWRPGEIRKNCIYDSKAKGKDMEIKTFNDFDTIYKY